MGDSWKTTLTPGTVIDRYGDNTGYYTSPYGTPYDGRSLKPMTIYAKDYHVYVVQQEVEVEAAIIAPWFGKSGGGTQYKFDTQIVELLRNNTLTEIYK